MLISAIFTVASSCFAQSQCGSGNPMFKSDKYGEPKEIYSLGSNPEFPFLRNLSTPEQVASAMKRTANRHGMSTLNRMLMDMGFTNGAQDVTASSVAALELPSGTIGNMGDGSHNISYVKLMAGEGSKAWKITSPTGCYVYVLAKCGNAFYPAKQVKPTASLEVPLNLNSRSKDITLECGATKTTTGTTYVYYHKNKYRSRALAPEYAALTDPRASTPVLLNTTKKVEPVPQTYTVTVNTPDNNVRVYEDRPLEVTTNINVERTSDYTGYYTTSTNKQYKEVSRRVYNKSERKMRHALRKEEKIARMTEVPVTTDVAVSAE